MHEVLVNRLGGLSLPRKSVVRLTDRPNMSLDVYRGHKTTLQQQMQQFLLTLLHSEWPKLYGVLAILTEIGLKSNHDTFELISCSLLGAPVAQWVKRWPTDLADRVRSSLKVKSSQL